MTAKLTWQEVGNAEGLRLAGFDPIPKRGSVLTSKGAVDVKRYSFHHRKSDDAYLVRWGRLDGATVCRADGKVASVIFKVI